MVDTGKKIDNIIQDYIDQGCYFTINRARQYGKTTTLYLLEQNLKYKYIVLSLSFECADEYFKSAQNLVEGLMMDISDSLEAQGISPEILKEWNKPVSERFPLRTLQDPAAESEYLRIYSRISLSGIPNLPIDR